jgi:hypothetical protein
MHQCPEVPLRPAIEFVAGGQDPGGHRVQVAHPETSARPALLLSQSAGAEDGRVPHGHSSEIAALELAIDSFALISVKAPATLLDGQSGPEPQ